ncbi:LacI family DNA-binding transcriptional regulator [Halalkalibacter krulwichiae]|uniref:Catabolite control protein A n=1 Tax=Halalkalibacter krulwichiae TaxID=199441 RepID=A0A1X9MGQ5_9BACI|nr:LacI family DNA-binding transcriptional regulator [Halalkalibacter krulwichiae]ARK32618.1 Catabolite control protein A [Halalkalibacter krulwichiae]
MTTIRDVAKHAQVSVATVSRVLNQKGYVSKKAEEAVMAAIKELDFRPNAVARTLYNKSSRMIGLIVPDITNPFFPELARAVEDIALTYGYTVVLCNADEDIKKERNYLDVLKQKYVDGIILTNNQLSFSEVDEAGVPMVALDRVIADHIPTVVSTNKIGAEMATKHLVESGCKFIAHLRGPKGLPTADQRLEGFRNVVEQSAVASVVVEADFHYERSELVTEELLKQHPSIDGIFASSDVTAAGALKAISKMGKRVPEDIQIVGFDGIPFGEMLVPSLTTIAQPIYQMGATAARLLIKLIEKKPIEGSYFELSTDLIIRETTKGEGAAK